MNKKHPLRLLSLLLALLMLPAASACAGSDENDTPDTVGTAASAPESETVFEPAVERKNYDCEFIISDTGTLDKQYWFVEQRGADTMSDAVYERLELIRDRIGVTVKTLECGDWIAYAPAVVRTVQAGDDVYQLVPTNTYQGIPQLITTGSLYDFNDLPSLELNAPYWRTGVMDDLTVNGKRLLGYNDFCLSFVHIFLFNKNLMEQYVREDPYALVRNKQWTIDKLFSMASAVAVDDGDGQWTAKDTYGLAGWGWHGLIDFVPACGLKIVDRNADGYYYIAYESNADKVSAMVEKIYAMYTADYSWLWKSHFEDSDVIPMESGRVLFGIAESFDPITLKEYDVRIGILPYPLYDEAQENYRQLSWNGLLAVPSTIRNVEMVSDTVELLAAYAGPVKDAFYVNLLGSKSSDTQDDSDMLDIIWEAQVTDVGLVYCNCSPSMDELVYMVPKMCEKGNTGLASYLRSFQKSAQRSLDGVFEGKNR